LLRRLPKGNGAKTLQKRIVSVPPESLRADGDLQLREVNPMRTLVLLLVTIALAGPAGAQKVPIDSVNVADTASRHAVRLKDGSTFVGRISGITADSVRLRLEQGEVSFARSAIAEVRQFPSARIRNGSYWFENPHPTRLLFSSTAFPLEKGTGYYSNTWLALHTFATGLTDRFTFGGGLAWFPGVSLDETFYYLLPKYTVVNGERTKVAIGALVGLLPFGSGDDGRSSAGILYGVGTTGNRDSNLSLGLGWGYAGDEVASNPIVMVGGQGRISRRISLISENWVFPISSETEGVYSYGIRFLGEGLSVDLAFVSVFGESGAIPWLGFAFRF